MSKHKAWIEDGCLKISKGGAVRTQPFSNPPSQGELDMLTEFLDSYSNELDRKEEEIRYFESVVNELHEEMNELC